MSFRARYEGVCADCDEPIQVGQLIRTTGDEYVVSGSEAHDSPPRAARAMRSQYS